ncbi:hypothetical protein BPA30113_02997 [Burkholderia paludis]|uniref:Uncharacterized protein n=1 Tax=Burkholderia paludis TaxID=1506587 RepID=A0A6J5DHF5_9BURK|nr:hypothetical protein LMG30113_01951 [Burkholderia paludis]VWB66962.1 hypothetical protein BPA30113_02997 [Burkholderia paludis]
MSTEILSETLISLIKTSILQRLKNDRIRQRGGREPALPAHRRIHMI